VLRVFSLEEEFIPPRFVRISEEVGWTEGEFGSPRIIIASFWANAGSGGLNGKKQDGKIYTLPAINDRHWCSLKEGMKSAAWKGVVRERSKRGVNSMLRDVGGNKTVLTKQKEEVKVEQKGGKKCDQRKKKRCKRGGGS